MIMVLKSKSILEWVSSWVGGTPWSVYLCDCKQQFAFINCQRVFITSGLRLWKICRACNTALMEYANTLISRWNHRCIKAWLISDSLPCCSSLVSQRVKHCIYMLLDCMRQSLETAGTPKLKPHQTQNMWSIMHIPSCDPVSSRCRTLHTNTQTEIQIHTCCRLSKQFIAS